MAEMTSIKAQVVRKIAGAMPCKQLPKHKMKVGHSTVHVRFRTTPKSDGVTYAFNINPNTLTADYELWICGSSDRYYLVPIREINALYHDPSAYPDYAHPGIRVVDVNTRTNRCLYGRGGLAKDFSDYFAATL